jgi:hypothetical protein
LQDTEWFKELISDEYTKESISGQTTLEEHFKKEGSHQHALLVSILKSGLDKTDERIKKLVSLMNSLILV